mgnify:CR=1 FL=1
MKTFLEALFAPMNSILEAIPFAAARPLVVGFLVAAAVAPLLVSKDFVKNRTDSVHVFNPYLHKHRTAV